GCYDFPDDYERHEDNKILDPRHTFAAESNVADRQCQSITNSGTHDSSLGRGGSMRK
ncbi:MAG: hypothetical protein QOJ40_545, partial [Verrucomicrobiota bacterium]